MLSMNPVEIGEGSIETALTSCKVLGGGLDKTHAQLAECLRVVDWDKRASIVVEIQRVGVLDDGAVLDQLLHGISPGICFQTVCIPRAGDYLDGLVLFMSVL